MGSAIELLLNSAYGSFIQVTVFVGAALLFFGYINYSTQGRFVGYIEKSRKYQPVFGALLGLTPGCGGAIFIMPLFVKGTVSFGTVVATLIATAGDSAFLTITKVPSIFLAISGVSFIAAVVTGYVVDFFNIGEKLRVGIHHLSSDEVKRKHEAAGEHAMKDLHHIGHTEGDEVDVILHHTGRAIHGWFEKRIHQFFWSYWIVLVVGLVFGIAALMNLSYGAAVYFGVTGTVFSILITMFSGKFIGDDTHEEAEHKLMSVRELFIHTAVETAFVGTWVFVAYGLYDSAAHMVGGDEVIMGWMGSVGLASVLAGVLIGLVPGCGPQVLFVSLYLKGALPFAAVAANAVSQDGDALFPLLALDRKSAWYASVITTVPALAVGLILYYLF